MCVVSELSLPCNAPPSKGEAAANDMPIADAINTYSIAVAPESFFRNAIAFDINEPLMCYQPPIDWG